jgi:hypothetical protein
MINKNVFRIIFLSVFCLLPFVLYAQNVSSKELLKRQEFFDGKEIIYRGKIIGEMMCREKGCWLNVKDGDFAIGVWVPSEIKFIPKYTTSYKYQGDEIEIRGIFNRFCKQHLGEADIHAQQIRLIREGGEIKHSLSGGKRILAIIIWGCLCLILILMRLKKI